MRFLLTKFALIIFFLAQNQSAQEHAEKALAFVQSGDLKGAEGELRKAVALSPQDPNLLTSLGGILSMEGDWRNANPYLTKAVELSPQNPALRRNLAANQWQLGRLTEARANLERLLKADGNDKTATFLLGMVCEAQGEYVRSAALLESVPESVANQPQGWVALASDYYHMNRPQQAGTTVRNLLSTSQNPEVSLAGAKVAMDAHDYPTAESLLTSIRSKYSDSTVVDFQIALTQCRSERFAECQATLRESIETGHAGPDSYVLLCRILAGHGQNVSALELATKAANKFADAYQVFSAKASLEMKLQYFLKAVDSSRRAFDLHASPETMTQLASAEWQAGIRQQAVARFEQLLRQNPRDATVRESYGKLLLAEGSPASRPRAIELLKQALAIDNSSEEALFQLANIELADGRPQQALRYLEEAVKRRPDDSRVHYALSRTYAHLQRSTDAERELQNYMKLTSQPR